MGGTKNLDQAGRGWRKNLGAVPLWWKFKGGLAEKASAALFRSVAPPFQITPCQGFGDSLSQPGGRIPLMPPETEGLPFAEPMFYRQKTKNSVKLVYFKSEKILGRRL
jgi:hypothetical protein